MISVIIVVVLVTLNLVWGMREYEYELTVRMDPNDPNYNPTTDYNTINEAILAMNEKDPPLSPYRLGCIEVYPGTYTEQLNDAQGGNDLPAHCDLIGKGTEIDDVIIQHAGNGNDTSDIYNAGVNCSGNNIVSHLKIHNYKSGSYFAQINIRFNGDGTLDRCISASYHGPAVIGHVHLVVSGSETDISTFFRSCIKAYSTFEIYDCTLRPGTYTLVGQSPGGISVMGSGIIDNVTITTPNGYAKERYTKLWGIKLDCYSNPDAVVYISNTTVSLKLTSLYNETLPEFNVVGGIRANKAFAIVEDCAISVTGIEDDSDPAGVGAPVKVRGIDIGNGALVEVLGSSSISTYRMAASHEEEGHEYLLINGYTQGYGFVGDGTLAVDFDTVAFDPNGPGEPDSYDLRYVHGDVNNLDAF
jgi:hypothetical protein